MRIRCSNSVFVCWSAVALACTAGPPPSVPRGVPASAWAEALRRAGNAMASATCSAARRMVSPSERRRHASNQRQTSRRRFWRMMARRTIWRRSGFSEISSARSSRQRTQASGYCKLLYSALRKQTTNLSVRPSTNASCRLMSDLRIWKSTPYSSSLSTTSQAAVRTKHERRGWFQERCWSSWRVLGGFTTSTSSFLMKSLCRTMLAEVLSSTPTTGSCVGAGTSWCGGSTSRSSSTLQTSLVTRSIMYVKLGDESLSPMRIRCRCSRANGESSCRNTSTHRPTTRRDRKNAFSCGPKSAMIEKSWKYSPKWRQCGGSSGSSSSALSMKRASVVALVG
mmetsp:Transcript_55891/g.131004  ORF Transcript_55891/g.131004 Transcript_55891/m.131004 type:complete len:338 (-) Transcript_55891:591-1604(-)